MTIQYDSDKIKQKLVFMQNNIAKLDDLRNQSKEEFLSDFRNVDSAKYLFQVTIEAMLDISNHIIARNQWGVPSTNKDIFQILSNKRIIEEKYINTYFAMAEFRNRIVHMYMQIDDEVIYTIVQENLKDLKNFIQMIVGNL